MKILSKIAVFAGIVAFMSSCEKGELPSPSGACPTQQENAASNQRVTDPADKPTSVGGPAISGEEEARTDEIVGGGDDDRNGGGDGKKEKKR